MRDGIEVQDALARLCNAESVLKLAITAHDQVVTDGDQFLVNESLHAVQRLLAGCYATLSEAVADDSEAAAADGA